jgi:hypothetical protein
MWQLVGLVIVLLVAVFFCIWGAVTVAWLSAFPNQQAARIELLERQYWAYIAAAGIIAIIEVAISVKLFKRIKARNKTGV